MDAENPVPIKVASGLSSEEAAKRLARFGPNAVKEERTHPVLVLLSKFWAPVPWMLEATLIFESALGRHTGQGMPVSIYKARCVLVPKGPP